WTYTVARHGVRGAGVDHRHPPARGEFPEPEDHRRRGEDPPGAGGLLADRGGALLPARGGALRGAVHVDRADDLPALPSEDDGDKRSDGASSAARRAEGLITAWRSGDR